MQLTRTRAKARAVAIALFGLWALPMSAARAAAPCLATDNPCDPDKLCTFKASLAEKVFIYQTYLRNSQVTKLKGKRDGVRYDGKLYDDSVKEARNSYPNDSTDEQMIKAGQIFQTKVRTYAEQNFKLPTCSYGGTLQSSLLPKPGYAGMSTNASCQITVDFEGGEYDAPGFGANDATSCPEFYDRDRAHEVIHQRRCQAAIKRGDPPALSINKLIEDEVVAYEHSVKLSQAYVRLLSIQCSSLATPDQIKARARQVQSLLSPYLEKGR